MTAYLLEYIYPYERFVFATEEKAKEHFIQSILSNCHHTKDLKIFIEQILKEHINFYDIGQFNKQFEEIATITCFEIIE